MHMLSFIDSISDTRCQGITDLQSLTTCHNHRDVAAQHYHAEMRQAAQCTEIHLSGCVYSHGKTDLKDAEQNS